jgi:translation initiation factor 5
LLLPSFLLGKGKSKSKHGANGSPTNGHEDATCNGGVQPDQDDDDLDAEELTQDAFKERLRELCNDGGNGIYMNNPKESANVFYALVKEKRDAGQLADAAVQKELVKQAENLNIKDKATLVLSELLFTKDILEEIKTHRLLLLRFCNENRKAQKYLLGGFEKLVGDVYKDELFGSVAKILKQFYDEDVLNEVSLVEWADKDGSKKYVSKDMSKKIHEKAAPFIKWLKEAEVESDDDEEDEAAAATTTEPMQTKTRMTTTSSSSSATASRASSWWRRRRAGPRTAASRRRLRPRP